LKDKIRITFPILLFCLSTNLLLRGATYTVSGSGGGNYVTIQACVNAMKAGDTCTVQAGTYTESVAISAGATGQYKTLKVNSGDKVTISGSVTLNSHTRLIGFTVSQLSALGSAPCVAVQSSATDVYITNNNLISCGKADGPMISGGNGSSYVYVQGNTLAYACSTPTALHTCLGIEFTGNHYLFENNDLSHMADGVSAYNGSYNVFRNNTMHDTFASECVSAYSGNCHVDFIAAEPTSATRYNLYEGNAVLNNVGGNAHVFLAQGDGCGGQCSNLIIRFNHAYNIGQYWLLNDLSTFSHVKDYNNTFSTAQTPQEDLIAILGSNYSGAVKNDLWYNGSPNHTEWYAVDAANGFSDGHNLAYISSCAPNCTFTTYGSAGFGMGHAGVGNITNQDPKFVNPAADWHLQAGSPAIQAGGPLTTAVGTGSNSTTLVVADADYFQDGMGLTAVGVQADWIRIGTSTNVQISAINYSTNTITLANPVSWSGGTSVYLYKNSKGDTVLFGNNPEIGAFAYGNPSSGAPNPPTSLTALVQ